LIHAKLQLLSAQQRVMELEQQQQVAAADAAQMARIQELMLRSGSAPGASLTGVELANIRRLMEAREQQLVAAATAAAATAAPSSTAAAPTPAPATNHNAGPASSSAPPAVTKEAPGLHLLLESLRSGNIAGTSANNGNPPSLAEMERAVFASRMGVGVSQQQQQSSTAATAATANT
jgi:hypothetical protein